MKSDKIRERPLYNLDADCDETNLRNTLDKHRIISNASPNRRNGVDSPKNIF